MSSLKEALADTEQVGADIELVVQNATTDRFQNFFERSLSSVMHMSCYGNPECVALENGFGYMQAVSADDLKKYVESSEGKVEVVVINSCHAEEMARAFLAAGIPHVVCLKREATFRDEGPVEFAKYFYRALAKKQSVLEAFNAGMEGVKNSPLIKTSRNWSKLYKLLGTNHDINIFFRRSLPTALHSIVPVDTTLLPKLPDQFVGREVDMYEILESLRVDDVIRVGGGPGFGKISVLSALSRYILERPQSFQINSIFWLPHRCETEPDPDSLYGDLCQVLKWILEADDDIWDEDDFIEARERIMLELEDQRAILIIDGRVFTTEVAGELLERLLTHLLNEATVKVILITASESARAKTRHSRSEETIVYMGPLDFKASALLFGHACPCVSFDGNPMVHTAEEFHKILVPPSVANHVTENDSKQAKRSRRQQELYELMGNGNPRDIIEKASSCTEQQLCELLRLAKRPEVSVSSASELEAERTKCTTAKEKAISTKNYLRAKDLVDTLDELEALRETYPNLEDLQKKEADYKKKFTELLKAKRYDDANLVKRKILSIKRTMMKERYAKPASSQSAAMDRLQALQDRMNNMMALAESMDKAGPDVQDLQEASLKVSPACVLEVSSGTLLNFKYKDGISGLVCWTNEACDLNENEVGKKLLAEAGPKLDAEINGLETLITTEWGPVKCATGESVSVGPAKFDDISARYIFLSVAPLSPTNDDTEWDAGSRSKNKTNAEADELHYLDTGLRAAVRSSFRNIKNTGVEAVGIPTITTSPNGSDAYERSLRVVLETIVEESKRTNMKAVHLIAASGDEANRLIKMALETGLAKV